MKNIFYTVAQPETYRLPHETKNTYNFTFLTFTYGNYSCIDLRYRRCNSHVRISFIEVGWPIDDDIESRFETWLIKAWECLTRMSWLKMTSGVPTVRKYFS